jgi:hypothetical protein
MILQILAKLPLEMTWHVPLDGLHGIVTCIAKQCLSKHSFATIWGRDSFLCGPCQGYITPVTNIRRRRWETRVEAGSNTSIVTLRVVGGDEKGSLRTETVKYGRKSQGTRTRERPCWQGPAAYTKDRPVLSSERAPYGIKNVTVRRIPCGNKNLVVSPGWVLYTKTDWPTDRRS